MALLCLVVSEAKFGSDNRVGSCGGLAVPYDADCRFSPATGSTS